MGAQGTAMRALHTSGTTGSSGEGRHLGAVLLPDAQTVQCIFRPRIQAMKVQYFDDTDTLYIEFRDSDIAESRDLDENTTLDTDSQRNICTITVEHASQRTDIRHLTVEGIVA